MYAVGTFFKLYNSSQHVSVINMVEQRGQGLAHAIAYQYHLRLKMAYDFAVGKTSPRPLGERGTEPENREQTIFNVRLV
jgi:hypothetical protein